MSLLVPCREWDVWEYNLRHLCLSVDFINATGNFLQAMEPEIGKFAIEARDESLKEAVAEEVRLTDAKCDKNNEELIRYEYSGDKYPVITCGFG